MRPSPRQLASSRASGTLVDLPAPGGATSTASGPAASALSNCGSTSSIGSGVWFAGIPVSSPMRWHGASVLRAVSARDGLPEAAAAGDGECVDGDGGVLDARSRQVADGDLVLAAATALLPGADRAEFAERLFGTG